jgi:hypothetical protein
LVLFFADPSVWFGDKQRLIYLKKQINV